MKNILFTLLIISLLGSCSNKESNTTVSPATAKDTATSKASFFPVTSYLKGQLYDYKTQGKNPVKYTTIKNHTDSIWLKQEEVEQAVKEFLTPEIDSTNLTAYFSEKKFGDETLGTFTFTYEPAAKLPDSLQLSRWDVYIDPEKNKVKRVYMVKEKGNNITLLLTWLSDRYCTIVTIANKPDGSAIVEKEEKISWDF